MDNQLETRITTGLAISKEYIGKIRPYWNPELIETPDLRMIAGWCVEHFDKYGKVIKNEIEARYEEWLKYGNITKAQDDWYQGVFKNIQDHFDRELKDYHLENWEYLRDLTIKHFKDVHLGRHQEAVDQLRLQGRIEEAEELETNYRPFDEVAGWSDPEALPEGLPEVAPFPVEALPDAFRPWVLDIADRMQAPIDYVAVAAMVAVSSVIGRRAGIYPKQHDDWLEVANLWGGVVGKVSSLKSPSVQQAQQPIDILETDAHLKYEEAMRTWKAREEVDKMAKKARETEIKNALKAHRDPGDLARELAEKTQETKEPVCRRYKTNDTTVEALGVLLNQNPYGVLVLRDELDGLLRRLNQEGHEQDRSFYLEAWRGMGPPFIYDRIGRGKIRIESACVSMFGTIPPEPSFVYSGRRTGCRWGWRQRFQLMVWPDQIPEYRDVDRAPNAKARRRALLVFKTLSELIDDTATHALHFDEEAQAAFREWREALEYRLRNEDTHPAFEAHIGKYRSLVPKLALNCYLADGGRESVDIKAFNKALMWCQYLESHARRIYHALIRTDQSAAHNLGQHILHGDLPSPFKVRDVHRNKGWSGLTTSESVQEAVNILCEHNWLKAEEPKHNPKGGRPTIQYQINPKIGFAGFVGADSDGKQIGFAGFAGPGRGINKNLQGFAGTEQGLRSNLSIYLKTNNTSSNQSGLITDKDDSLQQKNNKDVKTRTDETRETSPSRKGWAERVLGHLHKTKETNDILRAEERREWDQQRRIKKGGLG